jgi:hypothetical protein
MRRVTVGRRLRVLTLGAVVALALAAIQAPAFAREQNTGSGGVVLPPSAMPHGFSLSAAALATAVFNTTNHSGAQPDVPFQMLVTTATNTFNVRPGTMLYVPVAQADDSPPILGDFPQNSSTAVSYFFGSSELGGHNFSITVDGKTTPIGSQFLVGPVTTAPLADGGGTHYMTLAAFLTPLTPGTHTVAIEGHFSGAAVLNFFHAPVDFVVTYTVNVRIP